MKKLINDPKEVVNQMIEGIVNTYPNLSRLNGVNVIVRKDCRNEKVK